MAPVLGEKLLKFRANCSSTQWEFSTSASEITVAFNKVCIPGKSNSSLEGYPSAFSNRIHDKVAEMGAGGSNFAVAGCSSCRQTWTPVEFLRSVAIVDIVEENHDDLQQIPDRSTRKTNTLASTASPKQNNFK